jgi:hypothetical protein
VALAAAVSGPAINPLTPRNITNAVSRRLLVLLFIKHDLQRLVDFAEYSVVADIRNLL